MAILVSAIIASIRVELVDPSPGATWLDTRFLTLVNEAERAIINAKHDAYVVRGPVALVAGTRQQLPSNAVGLMDVYENVASGRRITSTHRELLDAAATYFPAATPETDVQHYVPDVRNATRFEVTPPNDGTGNVYTLYGAIPTPLTAVGDAIHLDDTYEQAIKHFVIAQCCAENTPRQDLGKAGYHEKLWRDSVGAGAASEAATAAPQKGDA